MRLTAMVMNLKRLTAFLLLFFASLENKGRYRSVFYLREPTFKEFLSRMRKENVILKISG